MSELRFDDRVAIVTGAGGGLGREHALLLGSLGAKVVVNDLGGGIAGGDGESSSPADAVVAEIKALGGEAVANYDSVTDGEKVVKTAIDTWGRVDIVINNAGILRDMSFKKMTQKDWDIVIAVHLQGAQSMSMAAWPYMLEAKYGRIVMTTSAAGIYGNFGQANYSAAKLGMVGLANTLSVEGASKNIKVNTIAPIAASRLTETVMPADLLANLKPEYVSPLVAWLAHEGCEETKGLFEVGAGYMAKVRWQRTKGHAFGVKNAAITPDAVAAQWDKITNFDEAENPADINAALGPVLDAINNPSKGGNEFIDVDVAMAGEYTAENSYDERDLSIYALGIGAAEDPLDAKELAQVYEMAGDGFKAAATYAAMPAMNAMLEGAKTGKFSLPGLNYGFDRVLHGEQYTEIKQTLLPSAALTHTYSVKDIYDKAPNAVVIMAMSSKDEDGNEVAYNEQTIFVRGAGGWGGDRGPSANANELPSREPDQVVVEKVPTNQALLYRLSGDWNPLHADPNMAKAFGFDKPILHGMCTYGYVGRHIVSAFCDNDPRYLKSIKVRFAESVFPGETIETRLWKEDGKVIFESRVQERDLVVIQNAAAELFDELPKPIQKKVTSVDTPEEEINDAIIVADVYQAMAKAVASNPGVVDQVKTSFQFNVSDPEFTFYLDLKSGEGTVALGTLDGADVTLEINETNFIALAKGEADAQKMFFAGDLQVSGNVMASNNLAPVFEGMDSSLIEDVKAERLAAGGSSAGSPASGVEDKVIIADIFSALSSFIEAKPSLVNEVETVFQFEVSDPDSHWFIDLKNGEGSAANGLAEKPDVTLALSEDNLMGILTGKADAQKMFFSGDLKISGNMMASNKLAVLADLDPALVEAAKTERLANGAGATDVKATAVAPVVKVEPQAGIIFKALATKITKSKKVKAIIQFNVSSPDSTWTVDLAKGSVSEGDANSDVIINLEDKVLTQLVNGVNPAVLFQKGELSVSEGDVLLAHNIEFFEGVL